MNKRIITSSAIFFASALSNPVFSYEMPDGVHGYFRTGVFTSTNGAQEKWAPGKIGRIGNEVDGWWDLAFKKTIYQDPEDSDKKFNMVAGLEGLDMLTGLSADQSLWMVGFTLNSSGFIPNHPEANFWVGKNKYQYHGIEMMDWKSVAFGGPGVGVEHIDLGSGKLSLAISRLDADTTFDRDTQLGNGDASYMYGDINTLVFDARYADIAVTENSKFEGMVQLGIPNKTEGQEDLEGADGIYDAAEALQLTGILSSSLEKGGFNELTAQFATGSFAGRYVQLDNSDTAYYANADYSDSLAYRLINTGEFYFSDNIIMAHSEIFTYGKDTPYLNPDYTYDTVADNDVTDLSESYSYTVGIRPMYIWNKNHKTGFETFAFKQVNTTEDEVKMNESGYKFTLLHTMGISTGMLQARPEIRFYASYVNVDENDIDGQTFKDNKSDQLSFGIQAEAWF